ncbi:MAG: ABC transporter substrate-binding protein [Thermoanaerobaculia bacterium]
MRRIVWVGLFAGILAGCGGEKRAARPPEPVRIGFLDETAGSPRDGGTLYRRLEGEPVTLNPILQTSDYEEFVLAGVSRNLIDFDKAMKPLGGLCDRWEISPDQRVVTLHLRQEAVWQDGSPVTSKDAIFTIEKVADPKSEALFFSPNFDSFQKAEALDDRSFRVTFTQPYAYRLYAFNLPLLPAAIYAKQDLLKAPENRAPVSNGPYRFVRWRTSESIELSRNERYWGPRPHFDRVLFRIVPDQAQALRALERGDLDEMRVSTDQWKQARADPRFLARCRLVLFFDLSYFYVGYNNRSPLFSDAATRRALTMLLDRGSLVRDLFFGTARIISGPWAADSPAYDPSVAPYPFDPARAKEILASAGWKSSGPDHVLERGGKRFEFDLLYGSGSQSAQQVAEVFRDALGRAGIVCRPRAVEWAAFAKKMDAGDFDAVASSYSASDPNPDLFANWHSSQAPPNGLNNLSYSDPEADRLILAARLELDDAKRIAIDHRLHRILHDDEPATFALQSAQKYAISRRIGGLVTTPLGLFKFWPDSVGWWGR